MKKYFSTVINKGTGKPLEDATVRVKDSTGALVTIYTDENGTETSTAGEVTTDANGFYEFYVANGSYTLEFLYNSTLLQTITDVDISEDVTALQLADDDGSSLVGYIAAGTGAVARTAQDKLREGRVSVMDYGAAADGATDDRAAVQLALNACGAGDTLYFPEGDYFATATGTVAAAGEEAVWKIPEGVNVYMEPGAWIKLSTDTGPVDASSATTNKTVISAFVPAGDNVFQVNVDGQSLPEAQTVQSGTWINESFGVRAYGSVDVNIGANNVTVINSHFKNMTYCIQPEGAERWKIVNNRFERTKLSAIIWSYQQDYDCRYNLTANNVFENLGDCAVAHYQTDFPAVITSECAYNVIANNIAKNCNLRTQGAAYNVEPGGNSALQHHISFIGNTAFHDITGLAWGVGLIVMHGCSDSVIIGNVGHGGYNGNGDFGISISELSCRRILIANNVVSRWRGGGIIIDGSTDTRVVGNIVRDCGDLSNGELYPGILINLNNTTTRPTVSGNTIYFSSDNANVDSTVPGISGRTGNAANDDGGVLQGATIENNDIVSPWGAGIFLDGLLIGGRVNNVNILNNRFTRTDTASTPSTTLDISGVDQLLIAGNILTDCRNAYSVTSSTAVTIRDGEQRGSVGFLNAYDFGTGGTASTGVRVRNMRAPNGATTAVVNAGTSTVWVNDDLVSSSVKGATANRPTLTASDVAFLYLDTTLDADGKPIWWNGTAWVDATGATV